MLEKGRREGRKLSRTITRLEEEEALDSLFLLKTAPVTSPLPVLSCRFGLSFFFRKDRPKRGAETPRRHEKNGESCSWVLEKDRRRNG